MENLENVLKRVESGDVFYFDNHMDVVAQAREELDSIKHLSSRLSEAQALLAIYHDSLIKLDELSLALGKTISLTRIDWDDEVTCDGVLGPLNQIAKQIGEATPASIVATRPKPVLWGPITGEAAGDPYQDSEND